ncbi:peptidase C39 family protein [Goodfellowiella coeruleoviolacea]|uniref:Peptidase_C39 like family protein n=1 Tax=Goodfellowiella coeruleoviolacea TaxID=334858 RepID=A0AAE3GNC1_9PSEU|nr:peptidase C39 family protein [Goodfellowiella coeruleoviolacea]MCP2169168.1 Peptidase_C39 like family protein [Goodfellowiella coeruleoviolacea]
MRPVRTTAAALLSSALVASAAVTATAAEAADAPAQDAAPVDYHEWRSPDDWRQGTANGTAVTPAGLTIGRPAGTTTHTEPGLGTRTYEYASWTSPRHAPGFPATQLVASWNADTPEGTWLEVAMRGHTAAGTDTAWYVLGRWAAKDTDIKRTSVTGQSDVDGMVDVDTYQTAAGTRLVGYDLRVTLYRRVGLAASPTLSMVGAMTSAIPDRFTVPTSPSGGAWGIELPVPRYSQNTHAGRYPQYGGGGENWCSPTSTEMVVEYWGRGPSRHDLSWVDPGYSDPSVDHAARFTYDHAYEGTGNWPFNTAYAATYGLWGHITRLGSLTELEQYTKRGIPVITSQSFLASELDGAGYGTAGHIMVVIGFTPTGDVIVNDPASPNNTAVRHVYKRAQFETVWQRTKRILANGATGSGPGGVAYIITPPGTRLPAAPARDTAE